jgi:hypothetical protein
MAGAGNGLAAGSGMEEIPEIEGGSERANTALASICKIY